ncbi:hypothetical protein FRC04_005899 [Tulasnella sp. 424]|nr:hypothetical protein FRC04_005899 [Tulasnella sp. 424]KAG8976043.1 hypothetical protein FRC05_004674 [Tulasnella sp. 425]
MTAGLNGQPSAVKKSLYEGSTQFRHWRFSNTALAKLRASQNADAVAKIQNAFEDESPGSSSAIQFLSADEEYLLVKLYISKISQLCAHFRFPEEVEATAVSYLKRFYLRNTVMDYHPKNVMLTAIFLAAKTSNNPIGIEQYVHSIPKTKPADVLDLEFLVAQSLRFEFTVWHAHRALWGIWLDAQSLSTFNQATADDEYGQALERVRASRMTDAELIFTPSQIALACLHSVSPAIAEQWIDLKSPNSADAVMETVSRIQEIIDTQSGPPDLAMVKDIDRRLKICTNPEKVVGSKAYLAKQAEIEAEAARKRAKKAEGLRATMDRDPFADDAPGATLIPTESQYAALNPT